MMLMHLHCLVLKSRTMAWRRIKHCSLRAGCLSFASTQISPQTLCTGDEPEKKLWEGAQWDVCFQSWSQYILPGKLWLCRQNLNREGVLPPECGGRVEGRMLFYHFQVVLTAWCLTHRPKRCATWSYRSLELQAPIRNLHQSFHFTHGETEF